MDFPCKSIRHIGKQQNPECERQAEERELQRKGKRVNNRHRVESIGARSVRDVRSMGENWRVNAALQACSPPRAIPVRLNGDGIDRTLDCAAAEKTCDSFSVA